MRIYKKFSKEGGEDGLGIEIYKNDVLQKYIIKTYRGIL